MARTPKVEKNEKTDAEASTRVRKAAKRSVPEVVAPASRKPVFQRLSAWLDEGGWTYSSFPEKQYVTMPCRLKEAVVRVILGTAEHDGWERLLVMVSYPVRIAEDKRIAVLEALSKINYGLTFGTFDMDMTDGEVRYRVTMEADTGITQPMMDRLLNGGLSAADHQFGNLMQIVYGQSGVAKSEEPVKAVNAPGSEVLQ